ncbi:hypothetical protein ABZV31_06170 [Streptomyces sp. NPDC005202]|uniref:hypothetical protein n=1 Tax=Streptomyces sp. NPDC005202 TaxID=3157021 RepID=UPI0033A38DE5
MVDSSPRPRRTVILAEGYVALPLVIRAAQVGHRVIGFDADAGRVLKAAEPLGPDVMGDQIAAALVNGDYTPTTCSGDPAGFDVAVIAVPTPLRDGAPDLSAVQDAGHMLASHMRPASAWRSTAHNGQKSNEITRSRSWLRGALGVLDAVSEVVTGSGEV